MTHYDSSNISQLKDGLGAYIHQVRLGESVLVLDRKTPVARLVPTDFGSSVQDVSASYAATREVNQAEDEMLARLESRGLIVRSKVPLPLDVIASWAPIEGASLVDAVIDERKEDERSGYR